MSDDGERVAQPLAYVREVLPRSATIIEAFRQPTVEDAPGGQILDAANALARHHQEQWRAEDASRAPDAPADEVAWCKRRIDELNATRAVLVEQIDEWVTTRVRSRPDASLHTETYGSVIDRLAIAWVRSLHLASAGKGRDRARLALRQLAELADSYDDLIRDVATGQRRLPAWRPLKTYGSAS